jgi:FKBP-type peptidyl-prolyl cis-trans isomerase SlyD
MTQHLTVSKEHVVSINYRLTDSESGEELDSSAGHEPLKYIHGLGQIVPGLEKALEGKAVGTKETVTVSPEDGYGDRDDARLITVPKDRFDDEIAVGDVVQAATADGHHMRLKVAALDDTNVTLDANHPLAGRTLCFEVEVVEVRAATEQELSHGHAHCGGGGCGSCH